MASRKTERLINLTIALLATKRYLTKSEIFKNIEGYEGSLDSKERMFERDKDDLRTLGIEIEVGGTDPLFDDEPGYRIRPESYSFNIGALTGTEIALLSLAAEAWRGAALDFSAQSALVKLNSLGIESDFEALPALAPKLTQESANFLPIAAAIADTSPVRFSYLSKSLQTNLRHLLPYGLGSRSGIWYLVGFDNDRSELRTFRLDRILGEVERDTSAPNFTMPLDFNIVQFLDSHLFDPSEQALVSIRRDRGHALRQRAIDTTLGDEFDLCVVPFSDADRMRDLILWHGDDVVVQSPEYLRTIVITALETLVHVHG